MKKLKNRNGRQSAYNTALTGIMTAVTAALVYAASVVPGAELTLLGLAGITSGFVVMEAGIGAGIMMYAASLILSFLLVPVKTAALVYGMFFGIYGFVKYFCEKMEKAWMQIAGKLIFFAADIYVVISVAGNLLLGDEIVSSVNIMVIACAGALMFMLYDYIFTLALLIYRKRVRREEQRFTLYTEEYRSEHENKDGKGDRSDNE